MKAPVSQRGVCHHIRKWHDGKMVAFRSIHSDQRNRLVCKESNRYGKVGAGHPVAVSKFHRERFLGKYSDEVVQFRQVIGFRAKTGRKLEEQSAKFTRAPQGLQFV